MTVEPGLGELWLATKYSRYKYNAFFHSQPSFDYKDPDFKNNISQVYNITCATNSIFIFKNE